MHDDCRACGRPFRGDAGYFLGSIYFNYAVTGVSVVFMYFAMFFSDVLTDMQRLIFLTLYVVLFPIWFFRYARSLWMAFDELWDPWASERKSSGTRLEVSEPIVNHEGAKDTKK